MIVGIVSALLLAAPLQQASTPTIVVHEEGFSERVVAQEWARDFEEFDPGGPQADRAGNIYVIAPSGDRLPIQILKLTDGRSSVFAEVEGPGDPHLVGMGFDPRNTLVVIVHATLRLPGGGYGIQRTYHKISGFPKRADRVTMGLNGGLLDHLAARLPSWATLVCLGLTVCVAGAGIGRLIVRDVRTLFDR